MKKDLILITCFVPDEKRQQILRELVYNINKDDFDVMITSHTQVPEDILSKVDYMIYEKNNDLDFKYSNKFYFFFNSENLQIRTTEPKKYSHFVPTIRLIISGLIYAKSLDYKKVHYVEFDSLIQDDKELKENSKLLDDYAAVYYQIPHLPYPNSPISLNLEKISEKWFDLNPQNIEDFLRKPNSTKLIEEYEWELLTEQGEIYKKDSKILSENGIHVGLNTDLEKNKWIIPVYKKSENSIFIFSWVEHEEDVGTHATILVNDSKVININRSNKGYWTLSRVDEINNINKIIIIVEDKVFRSYNFDEESMKDFIENNFMS